MKTTYALVISVALASLVAAGAGMAKEPVIEQHSVYEMKVMGHDGSPIEVRLDSDELGFDAFDLAEGDSHSFTLDDGRPVTISNVEGEIWLDVDGELIELSGLHGGRHAMKMLDLGSDDAAFGHLMRAHHEGITIRSADPLDEETKTRIVQAIQDAGVDQDVFFAEDMRFEWVTAGDLEGNYDVDVKVNGPHDVHKTIVIQRDHSEESSD